MYLDIDTRGFYSINDITKDELNTILMSLNNFHTPRDRTLNSLSHKVGIKLVLQKDKLEQNGQSDKIQDGKS